PPDGGDVDDAPHPALSHPGEDGQRRIKGPPEMGPQRDFVVLGGRHLERPDLDRTALLIKTSICPKTSRTDRTARPTWAPSVMSQVTVRTSAPCLTGRLETAAPLESTCPLPCRHEHHIAPEAIPQRPDRLPVGQHRAPVPAGRWADRAATILPAAGDRQ